MKVVVRNTCKILIMSFEQVCFTKTQDMWLMLLDDVLDLCHFVDKKSSTLVPVCNFDAFVSVAIGASCLKVGKASEIITAC